RTIKTIAVAATVLLFLSLISVGYFFKVNNQKETDLNNERLKSENLLSEKLDLGKQIRDFKNEVASLLGKNKELDKHLNDASENLLTRERTINKLVRENAGLVNLKKENEAIKKIRDDLNELVKEFTSRNSDLSAEVGNLKNRISELSKENELLTNQLNAHEVNRLVDNVAGNFRIETLKKRNHKLTVKSSRTNQVTVSFNMPVEYSGNVNTEFFRIVLQNPEGGSINGNQQTTINTESLKLNASNDNSLTSVSRERVNISFKPTGKLKAGIYTVIVYEGNYILGSAQVRLAK
ncbi:MAG: hypothetical protein KFF73_07895, partial [Cyclobacteriaceae bacterium]|nr:hypothetical protein [Cyclobacteriaceae bacterium]